MRLFARSFVLMGLLGLTFAESAYADKIVLANDEWQTSDFGFSQTPAGSTQFALNVANFFTGGSAGDFLVVSGNFSLTGSSFASTLTGAGHTLVNSSSIAGFTFDVATLSAYDGVFLALPPTVDQSVLTDYVNSGGNVYINGGTGVGGPVFEAAAWNTFLNAFGLNFASTYNGIGGNIPISSSHAVLAGVSSLYQNNGNTINLVGGNPNAQIIQSSSSGAGLYAVYDNSVVSVPEPSSALFVTSAMAGLLTLRRRGRRQGAFR
jgi:hypothetical protein